MLLITNPRNPRHPNCFKQKSENIMLHGGWQDCHAHQSHSDNTHNYKHGKIVNALNKATGRYGVRVFGTTSPIACNSRHTTLVRCSQCVFQ